MRNSGKPPLMLALFFFLALFVSSHLSLAHNSDLTRMKGRSLMGFKEMPDGGNVTFDCSPSGPCIPCSRSEKTDEKYHCGETGYRIRLKCVPPSGSGSKDPRSSNEKKKRSTLEFTDLGVNQHNADPTISSSQRRLLSDSSKSQGASRAYVIYRSCIPAVNEEKLSVLGFEALMLALLVSSGSFIYFRRKRSSVAGGVPVRLPTNSRF